MALVIKITKLFQKNIIVNSLLYFNLFYYYCNSKSYCMTALNIFKIYLTLASNYLFVPSLEIYHNI